MDEILRQPCPRCNFMGIYVEEPERIRMQSSETGKVNIRTDYKCRTCQYEFNVWREENE